MRKARQRGVRTTHTSPLVLLFSLSLCLSYAYHTRTPKTGTHLKFASCLAPSKVRCFSRSPKRAVVIKVPTRLYTTTKAVRLGDMERRTPTKDPSLRTAPTKTTKTSMQCLVKE